MASGKSWLKGCALGCGLIVVLSIVGTIGGGMALLKPFRTAIDSREALEETYGTQGDYRPPADGIPAVDRVETFLDVRAVMMEHCGGFSEIFAQFRRMDRLEDEGASGGEKFKEVIRTVKSAFSMPAKLGKLANARNEALAEYGMGLGEYTYISALTYYAWLEVKEFEFDDENVDMEDSSPRVRRELRGMLRHQLEDLQASADPDRGPLADELEAELARLDDDRGLYPWEDNLPARIAEALSPYRGRLETTFCPDTAPFALSVHEQRGGGLSIHSD